LAIDLLYGPIYLRLWVGHLPLNQAFAKELSDWGLNALKNPEFVLPAIVDPP
jgi:hypothetical protein